MPLSSIYHSGPVTALCSHGNNTVLAGIGSCIHTYSIKEAGYRGVLKVLPGQTIHGIIPEHVTSIHSRVCIYGQKCFRLIDYDSDSARIKPLSDLVELSDWIWDITWLQGNTELGLALGHNVVVIFDIEKGVVVRQTQCQEKCILYCAKFLTSVTDDLVMAAGTVFNQVVLWSPASSPNSDGRVDTFHSLAGHQGVIFSIDYNATSKHICSVSDDRSIRLYQVKFAVPTTAPHLTDWETMDSSLLHMLYGHLARVWDVKLLSSVFVSVGEDSTCCIWSYDGHVIEKLKGHKGKSIWSMTVDKEEKYVVTGGGDHSVRLWSLQQTGAVNSNITSAVLNLNIVDADFPRNTMMLTSNRILVITSMGKLLLYNCTTKQWTSLMSDEAFTSYTVMSVSPHSRCIAIGNIVGTLRLLSVQDVSEFDTCQFSTYDMNISDGKILSVHWLEDDTLLTTGRCGIINIWKVNNHAEEYDLELIYILELPASKHRWVSTATYTPDGSHLVCGDRSGSVMIYNLPSETKNGELMQILPKIHGKAGVTHVCCHGDQIYSAGRDGLYRVYSWTNDGNIALLNSNRVCKGFEWLERLRFTEDGDLHIHGFHTDMFVVWSVKNNQKILELECGGGHRTWDYNCHDNHARFVYVKAGEVKMKDVVMRSNQVILKGSMHGRELCDVRHVCSAGHTDSLCDIIATCSEDTSVCLSLVHYRHGLPRLSVLHTLSGHISSVRCLSVCPSDTQHASVHRKLIFSAGGRAQLNVWRVEVQFPMTRTDNSVGGSMDDTTNRENYTSNETDSAKREKYKTCLENDILTDERQSGAVFISDLAENRTPQHNLTEGDCKSGKEGENGVDYRCSYEYLAGLHLGQIGRRRRKPWRQPADNSDPETRILDVSSWSARAMGDDMPGSLYFLSAACSDGLVRLLAFEEDLREITLLSSSSFHDHCVLKTSHVILEQEHVTFKCDHVTSKNKQKAIILSAATDGIVAFWDVTNICRMFVKESLQMENPSCDSPKETPAVVKKTPAVDKKTPAVDKKANAAEPVVDVRPFFTLKLHQSGINSLQFRKQSEDNYMLVTGGDDNALHVTLVSMVTMEDMVIAKVTGRGGHTSAHSAQITGVWCISPSCILTTSIDQRLCVWSLKVDDGSNIKVSLAHIKFVSVADIANMQVWENGSTHYIAVCGDGLEVLKLDTQNTSHQIDTKDTSHQIDATRFTKLAL